jgi:hypothetical protein
VLEPDQHRDGRDEHGALDGRAVGHA